MAHAKEDKEIVRNLYNTLEQNGLSPWFDEEQLKPGELWDSKIREAIRKSRFFLACISNHSINKEGYVQRELRIALNELEEKSPNTIYFIPCLINTDKIPELKVGTINLKDYQAINIDNEEGIEKLLKQLKSQIKLGSSSIKYNLYDKVNEVIREKNPNLTISPRIIDSEHEWDKTLMKDLNPIPIFTRGLSKVHLGKKIQFEISNNGMSFASNVILRYTIKTFINEFEFGIDEADVLKCKPVNYKTSNRTIEIKYLEPKRSQILDVIFVSNFPKIEIEVEHFKSDEMVYIDRNVTIIDFQNSDYIELGDSQDYRAMIGV